MSDTDDERLNALITQRMSIAATAPVDGSIVEAVVGQLDQQGLVQRRRVIGFALLLGGVIFFASAMMLDVTLLLPNIDMTVMSNLSLEGVWDGFAGQTSAVAWLLLLVPGSLLLVFDY
jgi:H+/Cl- antiporter ClcA